MTLKSLVGCRSANWLFSHKGLNGFRLSPGGDAAAQPQGLHNRHSGTASHVRVKDNPIAGPAKIRAGIQGGWEIFGKKNLWEIYTLEAQPQDANKAKKQGPPHAPAFFSQWPRNRVSLGLHSVFDFYCFPLSDWQGCQAPRDARSQPNFGGVSKLRFVMRTFPGTH